MFTYFTVEPVSRTGVVRKYLALLCLVFFCGTVDAGIATELSEKYDEIEESLFDNEYGIPIFLESDDDKDLMKGEVYGVIYHPFRKVSHSLASIKNWCEIMPQHLNIKACTYEFTNNQCRLTFFSAGKKYKKADNAYQLKYQFKVDASNDEYFNATLNAKDGPLDTTNYNIIVSAIPLSDKSTFVYISYQYRNGFITRVAMSTYLATIGRNKIGFSIEGRDADNQPVYIKGIRGVIERNAMRYYFAIMSYLNTQAIKNNEGFNSRISHWYDLTERYHKQLHEMDKADYLRYKKMERQDQVRLQRMITPVKNIETRCLH